MNNILDALLCPTCGSADVIPIVYGMPTADTVRLAGKEKVKLGGMCQAALRPEWICGQCRQQWNVSNPSTNTSCW